MFQHTAARRRLAQPLPSGERKKMFCFNTQPPEGGWLLLGLGVTLVSYVSTHSRPKAAGHDVFPYPIHCTCFNTQPPEGGWMTITRVYIVQSRVSTHSRPKAAGFVTVGLPWFCVCFNTQPPEGGWMMFSFSELNKNCFNTQPPEGGWSMIRRMTSDIFQFQHTAARRRLETGCFITLRWM
ncbi:hypothetical protein NEIMUCOT_04695 [Neisseria mucosa ATCC 25996]|uniref:Uncharacterized protein n=1 Tax=Neisseria mucosa (strain ATCC 25996 / DSM 4631 / NCTC 10774 / M26) TaxID=546266 RepID=D2ZVQ2_NEIM2|nr:hypothetical protein NEIMUCOT_04695 [Neisseria mucosa ATCC 25996]SUA36996.1 Uncharacterised protein [Neisseria mucosa]